MPSSEEPCWTLKAMVDHDVMDPVLAHERGSRRWSCPDRPPGRRISDAGKVQRDHRKSPGQQEVFIFTRLRCLSSIQVTLRNLMVFSDQQFLILQNDLLLSSGYQHRLRFF
jgi:hypothetical protein